MKKRMSFKKLIPVMVVALLIVPSFFAVNVWGAVVSTIPGDSATFVNVDSTISAFFSGDMNCSTLTSDTFYVITGTSYNYMTIAGSVACSGSTATFTPASPLYYDKAYTAIVTKAAKDQNGNPLTDDYEWSFTTIREGMTTFVESVTPGNSALNVDINAPVSVNFSKNMDSSSINGSTFYLMPAAGFGFIDPSNGTISSTISYSGTTATLTPSSPLDEIKSYVAVVTKGVKDAGGSFMPNSYKWLFTTGSASTITYPTVTSASPDADATDISTDTVITATFSEAMNDSAITTSTFFVNDGSANIAGTVTYSGTTATFTPSSDLSENQTYTATVTTGVKDLEGSSLQSDYIWSFDTAGIPTPPTVDFVSPPNNTANVPVNSVITATFSETLDGTTVTDSTFLVNDGSNNIAGTVTYTDTTATFTPASDLDTGKNYTATVTTGVEDLEGTPMSSDYNWSFTTRPSSGFFVESTTPANNAAGIDWNTDIVVNFSKEIDPSSVNDSTFYVVPMTGTVTSGGTTATFAPNSALEPDKTYTATITTGAKDLDGNHLQTDYTWSFTTKNGGSSSNPFVDSTNPADKNVDVALNTKITATFSEAMDSSTITTGNTFYVNTPSGTVSGTVSYSGTTATFTPTSSLDYNTTYTAGVTTDAKDPDGNSLLSEYKWSFSTATTGTGTISGTVYNTNGSPLIGVSITVWATDKNPCGPFDMIKSANVNTSSGTYSMSDLPTGTYYLRTSNNGTAYLNEWWASSASAIECSGAEGITLSSSDSSATDMNFQLDTEAVISGTVYRNDGNTPFTGDSVRISAVFGDPCGGWIQAGDAYTNPSDGTYAIHWLPTGSYYLRTWLLGNVEWWTSSGSVVNCSNAQALTISAGETLTGKDFQFEALVQKGDINGDDTVNLTDAVLILKVLAGLRPGGVYFSASVNDDNKIGMEEALHILREVVGLK
ncbi:MAG: hypothetical protein GY749_34130 [Desulfobacteraceae bacterium]|nr:hypothetical protein [Desulfobacteraceae bacterium]